MTYFVHVEWDVKLNQSPSIVKKTPPIVARSCIFSQRCRKPNPLAIFLTLLNLTMNIAPISYSLSWRFKKLLKAFLFGHGAGDVELAPLNELIKAPFTRYNLLSNRLSNRFDNRVNVCIHDTAVCQTGCQTALTNTIQPVVKPV